MNSLNSFHNFEPRQACVIDGELAQVLHQIFETALGTDSHLSVDKAVATSAREAETDADPQRVLSIAFVDRTITAFSSTTGKSWGVTNNRELGGMHPEEAAQTVVAMSHQLSKLALAALGLPSRSTN